MVTVSGPHNFQMDSKILQNSVFCIPVDHMKKPYAATIYISIVKTGDLDVGGVLEYDLVGTCS